jgi:hypothetical protein
MKLATRLRRRIAEIEDYMRSRNDAGGLLDELLELEAELRELEGRGG